MNHQIIELSRQYTENDHQTALAYRKGLVSKVIGWMTSPLRRVIFIVRHLGTL